MIFTFIHDSQSTTNKKEKKKKTIKQNRKPLAEKKKQINLKKFKRNTKQNILINH